MLRRRASPGPPGRCHPLQRHRGPRGHRLHQPGGGRPGRGGRSRGTGGGGRAANRRAGPPGPVLGGRTRCRPAGVDSPAPGRPPGRPLASADRRGRRWPAAGPAPQVGGFSPDLKWPNDLMVGDRKLAGILAEAAGGAVVVGMGLNVHGPRPARPGWTRPPAGGWSGPTCWAPGWPPSTVCSGPGTRSRLPTGPACSTIGRPGDRRAGGRRPWSGGPRASTTTAGWSSGPPEARPWPCRPVT